MIEGQLESMGPIRKGEDDRVVIGREYKKYHGWFFDTQEEKEAKVMEKALVLKDARGRGMVCVYIDENVEIVNARRKIQRVQTFTQAKTFFGKVKEFSKYIGLSIMQFFWLYPIATESFCVYDGDTVTVLGYLTYDTHLDCFEVKSPFSLWLGDKADYLQSL
jgi:hypothetical protein